MLVALCGLIGSGKGRTADILVSGLGFEKMSFADKLKDIVAVMYPKWRRDYLEGDTIEGREWREQMCEHYGLVPRQVLQEVGVAMREIESDIWVRLAFEHYDHSKDYVIPDCRFLNEIEYVKQMGGQVWKILRDDAIQLDHISEQEWQLNTDWDKIIANNGTSSDLRKVVLACISH